MSTHSSDQKGIIADAVNQPWNSARINGNLFDRVALEYILDPAVNALQPRIDIATHFARRNGFEPAAQHDTLFQLPEFRLVQFLFKLGLPGQDNLQELIFVGLQIAKQPQLFQNLKAQILRLIDQQSDDVSCRKLFDQILTEALDHSRPVVRGSR